MRNTEQISIPQTAAVLGFYILVRGFKRAYKRGLITRIKKCASKQAIALLIKMRITGF